MGHDSDIRQPRDQEGLYNVVSPVIPHPVSNKDAKLRNQEGMHAVVSLVVPHPVHLIRTRSSK